MTCGLTPCGNLVMDIMPVWMGFIYLSLALWGLLLIYVVIGWARFLAHEIVHNGMNGAVAICLCLLAPSSLPIFIMAVLHDWLSTGFDKKQVSDKGENHG